MSFTSIIFVVYLFITCTIYWLTPKPYRNYFLLLSSIAYAIYAVPTHALLLLLVSTYVYYVSKIINHKRNIFFVSIFILVGILAYFKYQGLLSEITLRLSHIFKTLPKFTPSNLVIPLGISFFTFKLIHYLADSYQGKREKGNFIEFLSYIFFFPILSSGPIERWPNFISQNKIINRFNWGYISIGVQRVLLGLFKKVVLADTLAFYAQKLQVTGAASWVYWIAMYAYAFQIYFDFSGYSDIAIGSAKCFGYSIIENFDNPYSKRNISLFWKSWHMSLTSWFTEYIFIPLGGSRSAFKRTIFNTFVVMAVTGLWHGAAIHFIFWGLYHAAGLTCWRIYNRFIYDRLPMWFKDFWLKASLYKLITFNYVAIGWIFFATNFTQSLYVLNKLFLLR